MRRFFQLSLIIFAISSLLATSCNKDEDTNAGFVSKAQKQFCGLWKTPSNNYYLFYPDGTCKGTNVSSKKIFFDGAWTYDSNTNYLFNTAFNLWSYKIDKVTNDSIIGYDASNGNKVVMTKVGEEDVTPKMAFMMINTRKLYREDSKETWVKFCDNWSVEGSENIKTKTHPVTMFGKVYEYDYKVIFSESIFAFTQYYIDGSGKKIPEKDNWQYTIENFTDKEKFSIVIPGPCAYSGIWHLAYDEEEN